MILIPFLGAGRRVTVYLSLVSSSVLDSRRLDVSVEGTFVFYAI